MKWQVLYLSSEIVKDYVIQNGSLIGSMDFDYDRTRAYPGVYEVIRVIDGVPLFLERHLSRFRASSKLLGFELKIDDDSIARYMEELIKANNYYFGNVKIIINNLDKPVQDIYAFFIKSKYPSQEEIENGVPTILFYGERNNPNAKSTDLSLRDKINQEISMHNVYEALLVNKHDQITEGSRSNLFAVKSNSVYTSPAKDVLQGVTRGYIMEICESLGYELIEAPILVKDLPGLDGLFLTGTSPQVLPISSVDGIKLQSAVNPVIENIRLAYGKLVDDYIKVRK